MEKKDLKNDILKKMSQFTLNLEPCDQCKQRRKPKKEDIKKKIKFL